MLRSLFTAACVFVACSSAQAQQNCPATPAAGTNNTTCANTAFVQKQIASKNYVVGPNSSTDSDVALFSGTSGALLKDGGSFSSLLVSNLNAALAPLMRSYLAGLTLSNDSGTPSSVLDIAAGVAADSTDAALISLGAFTKSTAGAWAAGSGSHGMGNGLTITNSTWYHVCLANNGGTPDIWFDTSAVCANEPTGITDPKFRRIGSFKTNGSAQIIAFTQNGDEFLLTTQVKDISAAAITNSAALHALASVPLGVKVNALFALEPTTASTALTALSAYSPDQNAPATGTVITVVSSNAGSTTIGAAMVNMRTNTSQQIGLITGTQGATLDVWTYGWVDTRGRFN